MATAYWSTVFERSADEVWAAIRAFDDYAWAGTGIDAAMEDGRAGDAVGGVRRVETPGGPLRQRLLAHSDPDRSYTYDICPPSPHAVDDYVATIRVTPVTDGGRAFVEWTATYDVPDGDRAGWQERFETSFAGWLESLRVSVCSTPGSSTH